MATLFHGVTHSYTHIFHVMDHLLGRIILGADYMSAREAFVDYQSCTMHINTDQGRRKVYFKLMTGKITGPAAFDMTY